MNYLYIIKYDCAHWCGADHNVLVYADSTEQAKLRAELHMEEEMRELFRDEYNDEFCEEDEQGMYDDESAVNVISVELFNEGHEDWVYYCDPSQSEFYPVIGEPD